MRTVLLLRHGKSSRADPTLADVDRPLTQRGERSSRVVGEYMANKQVRPSLVLCSPSRRTRQTLEAIEPSLSRRAPVEFAPELYAASQGQLLESLRALPDSVESVLVIGHNPGLRDLALALASRGDQLQRIEEKFPTAALATLTFPGESWAELRPGLAELVDYVVPAQLE